MEILRPGLEVRKSFPRIQPESQALRISCPKETRGRGQEGVKGEAQVSWTTGTIHRDEDLRRGGVGIVVSLDLNACLSGHRQRVHEGSHIWVWSEKKGSLWRHLEKVSEEVESCQGKMWLRVILGLLWLQVTEIQL